MYVYSIQYTLHKLFCVSLTWYSQATTFAKVLTQARPFTSFLVRAHSHQDSAQDLAYPATRRTGAPELGDPHARGAFIQRWGHLGQGSGRRGKVLAGASSSPWGQDQGHEELGAGGLGQWAQDHEVEVCRQCYEQFLFCGVCSLRARHLHQVLCWQCGNDKQPVYNTRVLNHLILFKTFIGLNYFLLIVSLLFIYY